MNLPLLQQWLALPAGAWPPDDRVLLGLPPGPVDAAAAEQNALTRMETLRPHQLLHPELVTEGMNRLAQALIAVSVPPPAPAAPAVEFFDFSPNAPLPLPPREQDVLDAEAVEDEVVDAEVVEAPPPPPVPPPRPLKAFEADPLVLSDAAAGPLPPPGATATRTDRRKIYRELKLLRQLRAAWERIGPVAATPTEPARSAEAVYLILSTRRELARLFALRPDFAAGLAERGRMVSAVFGQPHAAVVLRDLVPAQRVKLAADWSAGRVALFTRYARLRRRLRAVRPPRARDRFVARLGRLARTNPEWVLAALTLVVVFAALLRAVSARPDP